MPNGFTLEVKSTTNDTEREMLKKWISENKTSYLAHAVWSDNVEKLLSTGSLDPAEYQLRMQEQVSHEAGGQLGLRSTTKLPEKFSSDEIIPSLRRIVKIDRIPGSKARDLGLISSKEHAEIIQQKQEFIIFNNKDGQKEKFKITHSDLELGGPDFYIEGIPFVEKKEDEFEGEFKELESQTLPVEFRINVDRCSEEPVDTTLSNLWETYTHLKSNINKTVLAEKLQDFRRFVIPIIANINSEIRCFHNKIGWSYGDVVVLRGISSDSSVLSAYQPLNEAILLRPFENGGKAFSLDLKNDKNIIVLGPKAVCDKYKKATQEFQFIAFEDMTEEQLNFFGVPEYLRSYNDRIKAMVAPWDCKTSKSYTVIKNEKKQAIDRIIVSEGCDEEYLENEFQIRTREGEYIRPDEVKDYCEHGICEIEGIRYYEQQDAVASCDLTQFNKFDSKMQEDLLKSTFQEMQSLYGNYNDEGSTACMTVSWLEKKPNLTKVKYCNANVGDSASFLIILDDKNNVLKSKKINAIHKGGFENGGGSSTRVSRSIGDKKHEEKGLRHDPDIIFGEVELKPGEQAFMITACDGLTEAMMPYEKNEQTKTEYEEKQIAECVEKVAKANSSQNIESEMAFHLVKKAFEGGSTDNISVIVKEVKKLTISAVFDGHGGANVSKALGEHAIPSLVDKIYREGIINSYVKNNIKNNIKNNMLTQLANKIVDLRRRGGQSVKLDALIDIFIAFHETDLTNYESVKACQRVITKNLKNLEGFSGSFGKLGAWIKQSFFQTGYVVTMSDTRLQIGKLNDWIDSHALRIPIPLEQLGNRKAGVKR